MFVVVFEVFVVEAEATCYIAFFQQNISDGICFNQTSMMGSITIKRQWLDLLQSNASGGICYNETSVVGSVTIKCQ